MELTIAYCIDWLCIIRLIKFKNMSLLACFSLSPFKNCMSSLFNILWSSPNTFSILSFLFIQWLSIRQETFFFDFRCFLIYAWKTRWTSVTVKNVIRRKVCSCWQWSIVTIYCISLFRHSIFRSFRTFCSETSFDLQSSWSPCYHATTKLLTDLIHIKQTL